jgi:hypothetical protein
MACDWAMRSPDQSETIAGRGTTMRLDVTHSSTPHLPPDTIRIGTSTREEAVRVSVSFHSLRPSSATTNCYPQTSCGPQC